MHKVNRFESLATMQTSIRDAIEMMASSGKNKHIAGMVVVVDELQKVIGVVTDGDIRRGIAEGFSLEDTIHHIANVEPMKVNKNLRPILMRRAVMDEALRRGKHYMAYDRLVLVRDDDVFYDVIRLSDIIEPQVEEKVIAVYGLGFVGLTLAATMANAGLHVVGIDKDAQRVKNLEQGIAPFYENGLDSMLSSLAVSNPIFYTTEPNARHADVHIVSVGSPVDEMGKPNLDFVKEVSETISGQLISGDLVIFRSTVPVGTMRQAVLPILEKSGLECGTDFHLAFAPERTVEGNALEELRVLPQIVGGFNRTSRTMTARLFRHITNTIIEVESLEEAELVKLMNNTFRDLVFSFANEVANMCDGFNINAFNVIRAANEGYPRNPIPLPSPGVGGTCLSKDPYLYTYPVKEMEYQPVLGLKSREINSGGPARILTKLEQFAKHIRKELSELNILIVGLAFKGMPETSDIRDSVALQLINALPNKRHIQVKDFVVTDEDINALGVASVTEELGEAVLQADAVLVMNNHYRNNKFNIIEALQKRDTPTFIYDGWNMFNVNEIERVKFACYATSGYMSSAFCTHYHIARLRQRLSIDVQDELVSVDLDAVEPKDHVMDDETLLGGVSPEHYFFISGGGTLLVNGRYLMVVKRDEKAKINPNTLSLFTGRAEGPEEWGKPWLVLRELFEELTLYQGDALLYPQYAPNQSLIDTVYQVTGRKKTTTMMPMERIECSNTTLSVWQGKEEVYKEKILLSANKRQDINLLYIFAVELDLDTIIAEDEELMMSRMIAALDIETNEMVDLTIPASERKPIDASTFPHSENLQTVLEAVSNVEKLGVAV